MIQVSSYNETFSYNNPETLLNNIENDFSKYGDIEEIPLKSLIIKDYDYKNAMSIETVGDVWAWYWTRRR